MDDRTIKLNPDDAALVMNKEGDIKAYIPNMDTEDTVPDNVFFISALLLLANTDEEFNDYVTDKFIKKLEEIETDDIFDIEEQE